MDRRANGSQQYTSIILNFYPFSSCFVGHPDPDFIEVELPRGPGLDFELLLDILSEELGVPKNLISKVRKRPDTILRKDRDLMRLRDFEELEIVVSQTPCVNSPANGGRYVPKYGGVQARILY